MESRKSFPGTTTGYPKLDWSKRRLTFLYENIRHTRTSTDFYVNSIPRKGLPEVGTTLVTTRVFSPEDVERRPMLNRPFEEKCDRLPEVDGTPILFAVTKKVNRTFMVENKIQGMD